MHSRMWKNVLQYELGQDKQQDRSKPRDLKTDNNDAWTQDTERFLP